MVESFVEEPADVDDEFEEDELDEDEAVSDVVLGLLSPLAGDFVPDSLDNAFLRASEG